jgi:hypothetical protein
VSAGEREIPAHCSISSQFPIFAIFVIFIAFTRKTPLYIAIFFLLYYKLASSPGIYLAAKNAWAKESPRWLSPFMFKEEGMRRLAFIGTMIAGILVFGLMLAPITAGASSPFAPNLQTATATAAADDETPTAAADEDETPTAAAATPAAATPAAATPAVATPAAATPAAATPAAATPAAATPAAATPRAATPAATAAPSELPRTGGDGSSLLLLSLAALLIIGAATAMLLNNRRGARS